jgi:hypothetical protein
MNRRLLRPSVSLGILLASGLVLSCARSAGEVQAPEQLRFVDRQPLHDRETVLVVTPFASGAHEMWQSMRDEVSDKMDVVTVEMTDGVNADFLQMRIESSKPNCVVLVGNQAVRVFRDLQRQQPKTPPGVVAMSSFARQLTADLKNTTGIAYEVPAVTSFVALRQLTIRSLDRVGVVYRPEFEQFVKHEAELAKLEKVELLGRRIEGEVGPRRIRRALKDLLTNEKVDALWVLNDNALLDPGDIRDGWLPEARRSEVPLLVGVSSLVNPRLSFGTVAVVPDHSALGVQLANLLFELADDNWEIGDREIELPLSVETVVDMTQDHVIRFSPDAAAHIDRQVSSMDSWAF